MSAIINNYPAKMDLYFLLLTMPPTVPTSDWYYVVQWMQSFSGLFTLIGLGIFGALAGVFKKILRHGAMGFSRGFMYFFISLVVGCGSVLVVSWVLETMMTALAQGTVIKLPDALKCGAALICSYLGYTLSDYWEEQGRNPERLIGKVKKLGNSNEDTPSS